MKKIVIIAALVALTTGANAQFFDFSNNNNRYELGFNLGVTGLNTTYNGFGWGMNFSVWGGYIDFNYSGPEHRYSNRVNSTLWEDSTAFVLNVGYEIPILPWLRVIPLVGWCQTTYGLTDAETVNIETTEDNSRIFHDYNVIKGSRKYYFNFGAALMVQPLRWMSIYGVYTRNAIYGGLSFNLANIKDQE